jgi:hypothetical protein
MRRVIVPSLTALLVLAFTAAAAAEGSNAKTGGGVSVSTTTAPEPVPAIESQTAPSPEVATPTPEASKSEARLKAIRERASKMPAADREQIEKTLAGNEKDVDVEAVTNGDATVADRFAAEFGTTAEALLAERTQYNVGWGDVMIARTLLANAPSGTTIDQLYTLHSEELGWGSIAYGMGLRVGSVTAAVKTETLVARGTMKADGKTPKIGTATRVASAGSTHSRTGHARSESNTGATTEGGTKTTR